MNWRRQEKWHLRRHYVVTKLRQQVRHITVDRSENARAFEVHLRLVKLGFGLRETRLGTQALRFQRLDLPQRLIEVFLRRLSGISTCETELAG